METDVLQKYTQQTIVDDLLPAESSLLSQSMEVETRRGGMIHVYSFIIDIANTRLSLLNEVDSFDMLDGGMDMEPISDMFTLFI